MSKRIQLSKEEKDRRKYCNKCIYSMKIGGAPLSKPELQDCHCGYILITGKMRGCPGGVDCIKKCTDKSMLPKKKLF